MALDGGGTLVATFVRDAQDFNGDGWVYPGCVCYRPETLDAAAAQVGLRFEMLDWRHPRQSWALFARQRFDSSWFRARPLSWNQYLDHRTQQQPPALAG